MNILIIAHTFPRSNDDSTAAFMHPFATGLVESGHNVTVLIPFTAGFNRKKDPYKVITYKYIWPTFLHKLGYSKTMKADVSMKTNSYLLIPLMIFAGVVSAMKVVKKENIDIINVHWVLPNGPIAYIVGKLRNIPYVITLPGTDVLVSRKNLLFKMIARLVANNAHAITSNSSWLMNRFKSIGGIKEISTEIISYPADVSHLKPSTKGVASLKKRLGIKKNDIVLMAIGRLVYKKGFNYLIKAMPAILKEKKAVKLVVVGDGDLKSDLERNVYQLGVQECVIFAGTVSRDDIGAYYNMADIMIAPSVVDKSGNADGGPVVVLESMACAKAQVLTNILGMADNVVDNVGGFVVKEKSAKDLSDAVLKLVKSKSKREGMGRRNRKVAVNQLSTKGIGKKYSKLFQQIV